MTRRRFSAFTLIELLFVVAIMAVLAAIAVPNFLEAQTRVKVARVHTDMAATTLALNRYYADKGAYPPNTTEARRYLEAAMQNPVMDSAHTSVPVDVKIPWWIADSNILEPEIEGMGMDFTPSTQTDTLDAHFFKSPVMDFNSGQLSLLTTPINYIGTAVSRDIYASSYARRDNRSLNATGWFGYVNSAELFDDDSLTTASPGLWGDHLTSGTYFYLASSGPDTSYEIWHPLSGPFTAYDPTNGSVSGGDIFHFEGRSPRLQSAPQEMRPGHQREHY